MTQVPDLFLKLIFDFPVEHHALHPAPASKVIVCMMFRSNSNVLINIPPGHGKGSGNGAIGLNYGRFATKSFRRIMKSFRSTIKSIRCNQLLVLNSLKQFRMNYING